MKRHAPLNLEPLEDRALLSGLSDSLTTDATAYRPGQPVVMTFQETNVSDQTITVQDGPSIDGFTVRGGNRLIWRSNGGINPMFIRLVPLQPGQSFSLTATWDGESNNGAAAGAGTFVIQNELDPGVSATVTIAGHTSSASTGTAASTVQPIGVVTSPDPLPAPVSGTSSSPTPQPIGVVTSPDPLPTSPIQTSGSAGDPTGSPIAVTVSTNHPSYHRHHRVRIALTLRNVSDLAVTLPTDPTDQITVLRGSRVVWRDARVASGVGARTLQPGQSVTVTAVWNGKAHQARVPLAVGTYTVEAS